MSSSSTWRNHAWSTHWLVILLLSLSFSCIPIVARSPHLLSDDSGDISHALPECTLVATRSSWMPIGDLQRGELVWSLDVNNIRNDHHQQQPSQVLQLRPVEAVQHTHLTETTPWAPPTHKDSRWCSATIAFAPLNDAPLQHKHTLDDTMLTECHHLVWLASSKRWVSAAELVTGDLVQSLQCHHFQQHVDSPVCALSSAMVLSQRIVSTARMSPSIAVSRLISIQVAVDRNFFISSLACFGLPIRSVNVTDSERSLADCCAGA